MGNVNSHSCDLENATQHALYRAISDGLLKRHNGRNHNFNFNSTQILEALTHRRLQLVDQTATVKSKFQTKN